MTDSKMIEGKKGNRIEGLDGLRTLAIVGVTLFHMFPYTISGGYLGVCLFFVLTGFLLAYTSSNKRKHGGFRIGEYYFKRIRRIYPSLLLMLLVSIGVFYIADSKVVSAIRPEFLSVIFGYNNWWQIAQNADYFTRIANASPYTHLWFLGIELEYYLIWPVLFFIFLILQRREDNKAGYGILTVLGFASAVAMAVLYKINGDVTRVYYGTDTRIFALLFGAVLGLKYAQREKSHRHFHYSSGLRNLLTALFVIFIIITGITYVVLDGQKAFVYYGGMLLITLMFCGMIFLSSEKGLPIGRFLEAEPFRWIGRYSYEIFLWQYPVIFLFIHFGWNKIPAYPVLEIVIILLLSVWSKALVDALFDRKIPVLSEKIKTVQKILFAVLAVAAVVMMVFGCIAIVRSDWHKVTDQAELEARLNQNAADLQNQNNGSSSEKTITLDYQDRDDVDYSKTSNSAKVTPDDVTCIGDSVMLSASSYIKDVLPNAYIDAAKSRHSAEAIAIGDQLNSEGNLHQTVIVHLGTNGPVYPQYAEEFLDHLGSDRAVFWINTYGPDLRWQDSNNEYLSEEMEKNHSNVTIIDWYSAAKDHPEWFTSDGIHPNDEGSKQYAEMIRRELIHVLAEHQHAAQEQGKDQ